MQNKLKLILAFPCKALANVYSPLSLTHSFIVYTLKFIQEGISKSDENVSNTLRLADIGKVYFYRGFCCNPLQTKEI